MPDSSMKSVIADNLARVSDRIDAACGRVGRSVDDVTTGPGRIRIGVRDSHAATHTAIAISAKAARMTNSSSRSRQAETSSFANAVRRSRLMQH